ncbi:ylmG homolog protein 2, chloroplastic-like [Bidens hawaiensis]|uniref:ylmG homolog protein 2, chloroplastic-like n=1 Tax=Bidens hawaiensis TaxID=980011 RepID=UPI00404B4E70
MHPSSSTTQDSYDNNHHPASSKHNISIISLPLSSLLIFKPTTTNHFQKIVTESSNTLISNIQTNIHKCINFLHIFASQNPFFTKLHSLHSEYHKFCQINYRNQKNSRHLSNHDFAAIIPGDSVAGLVVSNGVLNFLNIYNTLLVVRLVLTWFPNSPPAIVNPLSTLCDPYLNIFRGVIPPLGGTLDLSPILAFLVLNALTSTASALPAELPSTESSQKGPLSQTGQTGSLFHTSISRLTSSQEKWMKRFSTKRSTGSGSDE